MSNLNNQVAIITGASQGIGKATAFALAAEGVNLVLSSRSIEKLNALKSELETKHPDIKTHAVCCDVSSSDTGDHQYAFTTHNLNANNKTKPIGTESKLAIT